MKNIIRVSTFAEMIRLVAELTKEGLVFECKREGSEWVFRITGY
jgi:hypothetical protein